MFYIEGCLLLLPCEHQTSSKKEIYGKIPAKHIEVALFPNLKVDETNYSFGIVSDSHPIQV